MAVNADDATTRLSFPFRSVQATPEVVAYTTSSTVTSSTAGVTSNNPRHPDRPTGNDRQGLPGPINPRQLVEDLKSIPRTPEGAPQNPCLSGTLYRAPFSAMSSPTGSPCFSADTSIRRPHPFITGHRPPSQTIRGLLQPWYARMRRNKFAEAANISSKL